ncbi:hypothetical protein ACFQ10_44470 [Streptomyces indonesiensis]
MSGDLRALGEGRRAEELHQDALGGCAGC